MEPSDETRGPGRPLAADRAHVERIAVSLMLRDGYETVTAEQIAAEAGIGRTTFFRYFGSKAGVVWSPFDDTIAWLIDDLAEAATDEDPLEAVREGIVHSARTALHSSDVWLERFRLLDTNPALGAGAYEHWGAWKQAITDFLVSRSAPARTPAVPMAIAGACQAVFVAQLRDLDNTDDDRDTLLGRLDQDLSTVLAALSGLLPRAAARPSS